MTELGKPELELRLARLEKRLRRLQTALTAALIVVVAGVLYFPFHYHSLDVNSGGILRVRGLIVEDAAGHDRILLGAPVPAASGRKRRDDTVGMIILSASGADRFAVGAPYPEPQVQGVIGKRIGGGAGLVFDDADGDERGGMGVMDSDGRATMGLDYPHGTAEAISLGVLPGETSISIHDSKTITRASLVERSDAAPLLLGLDYGGGPKIDMSILRLNPYRVRQVHTTASDAALNKALDDMGR